MLGELIAYPPLVVGFCMLLLSGLTFPITGVYLLRMNLLPMRFMLMHGAILGGAVAMAAQIDPFITTMLINLLLVWMLARVSRKMKTDIGYISSFIMVASVGLAFAIISICEVQAKDTLALLWGSLYTMGTAEMIGIAFLAVAVVVFQVVKRRELKAVFFDQTLAYTSGVNERALYNAVILITAVTVGMAMKMIGALLIDALLMLPALIATLHAKSFAGVVKWASLWGGIFAVSGFVLSLIIKIPVSSAIAMVAVVVFAFIYFIRYAKHA